jgi:hypothetical protein
MGKDGLFHLKKERRTRELKRSIAKRSSYDSVLIICEGEKTEINYFKDLIKYYRLNTANIEVLSSGKGSAPISIVNHAIKLAKDKKRDFDKIICVFDRDDHKSYHEAIHKINTQNSKRKKPHYLAITSTPCFEFWLLLHFKYTSKQYTRTSKCSACDSLILDLKQCFSDYKKSMPNLFGKLKEQLPTARENAEKLRLENKRLDTENPSTNIDEAINYLLSLCD